MRHGLTHRLLAHIIAEQDARRWTGNINPQPKDIPHERPRAN